MASSLVACSQLWSASPYNTGKTWFFWNVHSIITARILSFLVCIFRHSDWKGRFTKYISVFSPVDTGRKLNVRKTFRRRPGRLLNVLCTLNLRPASMGSPNPGVYLPGKIRIRKHITRWIEWLEKMTINLPAFSETLLFSQSLMARLFEIFSYFSAI